MMKRATVVDYGVSNILSLARALEKCGAQVTVTDSLQEIERADFLILPGVGSFVYGMEELRRRKLIKAVRNHVAQDKYFLGICLGMQMMMDFSEEDGIADGLGLIEGKVGSLPACSPEGGVQRVPHIAWNRLEPASERKQAPAQWSEGLLQGVPLGSYAFFVHSFYVQPLEAGHIEAQTPFYDNFFPSVIRKGHAFGVQFHPEKSGPVGLKLLRNFLHYHDKKRSERISYFGTH